MGARTIQFDQTEITDLTQFEQSMKETRTPEGENAFKPMQMVGFDGISSQDDIPLTPQNIQLLQRTVGNRAVTGLIQRRLDVEQSYYEDANINSSLSNISTIQRQPLNEEKKRKRPEEEKKKEVQMKAEPAIQRQPLNEEEKRKRPEEEKKKEVQMKADPAVLQVKSKFSSSETPAQLQDDRGGAEDHTSMPGPLKSGLEQLSGMNLSGIRVHHNSSKPAQLNALAYSQGQEIHVGPGQERHLPHEGWHVVQQMQGRVKPTMQTKGASINDDAALEREADVMGGKALNITRAEPATTGSIQPRLQPKESSEGHSIVQRAADRDDDGDEFLKMEIPDGTYVLEAANILVDGSYHLEFGNYLRVYGTASQYSPRHINGLNANPHRIDNTSDGNFRIVPGPDLEPTAGQGSAKIQAFRHNSIFWPDERVMEAYLRFDTVPIITINGPTTYVGGTIYDMRRANHQYFNLTESASAGQQITYSRSITNGYTLARGSSISNTLSSSVSSKIGASIEIVSAEVGSEISASQTITNSIQESISASMTESTSVSLSGSAKGPGRFVIIPTAKVWQTPVTMNTFDSTGKRTGTRADFVYTVIFNNVPSVLSVAEDGNILDIDGTPLPNP